MRRVRLPLVVVLVTFATGCHDKNPTGPSQAAAQAVTGLVISGVDAVLSGGFASYTATATSSDGTTRTVTPTWTSSDPAVASVDAAGHLDGRAHGSTNLTASYLGRDASKTVHVVNNYGGTWEGRYVIRACSASGDLTDRDGGWCRGGPGRVGTVRPVRLALSQTGSSLSDITGTLGVNEGGGTITGMVTTDGRLSLGGTFSLWDWEGTLIMATLRIQAWGTTLAAPGVMTGRWSQDFHSLYFRIGNAETENELVTMTQVSTAVSGRGPVTFTVTNPNVPAPERSRTYTSFRQLSEEMIEARVLAGIHFRTADRDGDRPGGQVAQFAVTHVLQSALGH